MSKNFDDFMKQCNNKDWSLVVKSATENISDPTEMLIHANLEINLTILREYHNWLNS